MVQNLWDTTKAVLRGKFIALEACLKSQDKSQSNLNLKELEKERSPKLVKRNNKNHKSNK